MNISKNEILKLIKEAKQGEVKNLVNKKPVNEAVNPQQTAGLTNAKAKAFVAALIAVASDPAGLQELKNVLGADLKPAAPAPAQPAAAAAATPAAAPAAAPPK